MSAGHRSMNRNWQEICIDLSDDLLEAQEAHREAQNEEQLVREEVQRISEQLELAKKGSPIWQSLSGMKEQPR